MATEIGLQPTELMRLAKRLDRERRARQELEAIAERVTRELYEKQKRLDLLQKIATAANEASSMQEPLRFAVSQVCLYTGWPVGHVYLFTEAEGVLVPSGIWHLAHPERFETFRRLTEATTLPSGIGLPGRVHASGKPAWIRDVTSDSNFPRAKAAKDTGVRAGFAFPVLVGPEVVAVLEFYSAEIVEPDQPFLEEISHIGTQLGRVVERIRTEAALREGEERYRMLFERNPQPMWVYDEALHRFLAVNDAAIRAYGYAREEFLRMTLGDIRPQEEIGAPGDHVAGNKPGYGNPGLCRHIRKDGSSIEVEISSHDLVFSGQPARLVLAQDVTERRSLEEQLRQSQKMEAVGKLAGGVAHDFNNLLTAITGYCDLIQEQLRQEDPLRLHVEEVVRAAGRAASLTRQLLAFSRQQFLAPKVLDVNAVVADMERMLRRLIGEHIEFITKPQPALGMIRTDPGQLEQVIMNLVVNARDAMPDGGRVIVETADVVLDDAYARAHVAVRPGAYVMLAVSDTGGGMDERTRARIFEPFFTTKGPGKGTGLGLSTVYGIIKQSGGNIWVYSEPNRGTTFKVYLPSVAERPDETRREEQTLSPLRGSETILLVEDEDAVRMVTREILRSRGYTVLDAHNGEEALDLSDRHEGAIDLVITDLVMPGMGGCELAACLSARRHGIKILYSSGYSDDMVLRNGMLEREMGFIQKPFSMESLTRKVREVLAVEPSRKT